MNKEYFQDGIRVDGEVVIRENAENNLFYTILNGSSFKIVNNYTGGGWARNLMDFTNNSGNSYFQLGGFGTSQVFSYYYLGKSWNNSDIKVSSIGNVAIGLSGSTIPVSDYKLAVYGNMLAESYSTGGDGSALYLNNGTEKSLEDFMIPEGTVFDNSSQFFVDDNSINFINDTGLSYIRIANSDATDANSVILGGNIKINSELSEEGDILTADASGNAVWKTPQNYVVVNSASDIVDKTLDSTKVYFINGEIDLGTGQIRVPEGGINFEGLNAKLSKLVSSENSYTMFIVDGGGTYSGSIHFNNVGVTVNGTSSQVFNLDNDEQTDNENNNIDWTNVNFIDCTSLGTISNYRQGFWDVGSIIDCRLGLTLDGTWSGGFKITSNRTINGSTNAMIKAGGTLTMAGRFYTDMFYTATNASAVVCDFNPSNILGDYNFQIIEGDFGGSVTSISEHFPNMPISSTKAFYDSAGIEKTNVGGKVSWSTQTATTFGASNTYTKALGTTTLTNNQWSDDDSSTNNRIKYLSTQPLSARIIGSINIDGGTSDEIGLKLVMWDDSASSFIDLDESFIEIPLFGTASATLIGDIQMDTDDYVELHIKNISDTSNVTVINGSKLILSKR